MIGNGDILETRIFCRYDTQVSINRRFWECIQSPVVPNASEQLFAQDFTTALIGEMVQLLPSAVKFQGVTVQNRFPVLSVVFEADANASGTATGDPLPPQTSSLIQILTARGGRKYRGRNFIPFPSEAHNGTDGKPTTAYKTDLADLAVLLTTNFTMVVGGGTTVVRPVLLPNGVGGVPEPVTGFTIRNAWSQHKTRSFLRRGDLGPFD